MEVYPARSALSEHELAPQKMGVHLDPRHCESPFGCTMPTPVSSEGPQAGLGRSLDTCRMRMPQSEGGCIEAAPFFCKPI